MRLPRHIVKGNLMTIQTRAMMKARTRNEDRTRNAATRVSRGGEGLSAVRRSRRLCAGGAAFFARAPRTRVPEKGRSEPEPARPEAKGHAFRSEERRGGKERRT